MKTKLSFIGRLVIVLWCSLAPVFSFSQQIPRSLTAANGTFIGFWEYKPTFYNADPNRKFPLIIFLHGIGERGDGTTQLNYVLANAIPKYINAGHTMTFTHNGQSETFLVLSPQLSQSYGNWPTFYVREMINYAKNNLRIDTNRIYLTGLSLGGGGTWRFATESFNNARQLAAIAPVCGTCDWSNMCNSIASASLPVWAFHASDDGIVGVGCTTGAISNINACAPAVPPLMTIYPNGNHFIWDRSYDTAHNWHNPNMYEWFLSHSRNGNAAPNIPPIARAGSDQTITLPVNSVTLNGSASSDPDGSITAYNWTRIGGPAQFSIASPNNVSTVVSNLAQGTYSFQLTVTDNRGATARDTVLVVVNGAGPGPNTPPVALAGPDQSITLPTSNTYLFGSASYDPDGVITNHAWSQVSGPAAATVTAISSTNVNVSNLQQGVYRFRLVVTDNQGATASDTVAVTVSSPNVPPVANAGPDQSIQLPTNSVTLNGAGSTDPDGTITAYAWTKIAGPSQFNISNAASVSTTVTNLAVGTYSFRLLITDNRGATDDDTVVINVAAAPPPPNVPPTANAGGDQSIQLPANSVTLSGAASSDADGSIVSYAWSKVAGPAQFNIASAGSVSTVVNNLVAGTYSFRLVVTDNSGATDDDTVVVTVSTAPPPPNVPPTANAGNDQSIQLPTNSITLNGSGSTDSDGSITGYAWSKISGPAQYTISDANNASTGVTNLVAGTYSFRLVVTDNNGATDDDTIVVNVAPAPPPPNVPPVANAGSDQTIQLPANSVFLSGAASSDADGNITAYAWTKIAGPAQYSISDATNVNTNVTNLVAGTYSFRLVVTDNNGATDDDTVVVIVSPAPPPPNVAPVARAGNDTAIVQSSAAFTLNGSASYDPDGSIVAYAWSRVSGPTGITIVNATTVTADVVGMPLGEYVFELTVTDNNGVTATDQVKITVTPRPNMPPVAKAGRDTTIAIPATTAWLSALGSRDPDGNIVGYQWKQVAGPANANIQYIGAPVSMVTILSAGDYQFELMVTDDKGASATDTVIVSVVNNFRYEESLLIYPNPVTAKTRVRCVSDSTGELILRVVDVHGKFVKSYRTFKGQSWFEQDIMLSELRPGMYYLEAIIGDKKRMIRKFIKQ